MSQPAAIEARILAEVGDTPDNRVSANLPAWWASHADKGVLGGPLQYLYTVKDAYRAQANYWSEQVQTVIGDVQVFYQQIATAKLQLLDRVQADIELAEARLLATRAPLAGQLTTTAPVSPPPGRIDANDPRFSGDPYRVRFYGDYGRGWYR